MLFLQFAKLEKNMNIDKSNNTKNKEPIHYLLERLFLFR